MTNFKSKACNGQSLIEILIGLTIGALLIGGAVTVIMVMVNSGGSSWKYQTASAIARSLLEQIRLVADANWYDIYDLGKGSGNVYYPVASSTTFAVLGGKEGILQNDIREGLVGYWKFDETSGGTAYDSTGNNNNGVVWNNPTKISPCRISSCFNFNGTSSHYIEIIDPPGISWLLDLQDAITVTAWIKPTNVTSGVIVAKSKTGGSRYVWELSLSSGYFLGKLGGGEAQSDSPIPINVWSYVVMTYDKNQAIINIYINGMPAGSDTETGNIQTSNKNLGIAKNVEVSGSNYSGIIDDVRIYNRALTADEIKILYNSSVFTRYFSVEDVARDNDGDIVSSGGVNDPSTQKITAVIEWFVRGSSTSMNVSNYVTRWKNKVFQQTDWSGAVGETQPITEPNNGFSSSSGISTSTGSIRIQGL